MLWGWATISTSRRVLMVVQSEDLNTKEDPILSFRRPDEESRAHLIPVESMRDMFKHVVRKFRTTLKPPCLVNPSALNGNTLASGRSQVPNPL
jgi:hypothetical protein